MTDISDVSSNSSVEKAGSPESGTHSHVSAGSANSDLLLQLPKQNQQWIQSTVAMISPRCEVISSDDDDIDQDFIEKSAENETVNKVPEIGAKDVVQVGGNFIGSEIKEPESEPEGSTVPVSGIVAPVQGDPKNALRRQLLAVEKQYLEHKMVFDRWKTSHKNSLKTTSSQAYIHSFEEWERNVTKQRLALRAALAREKLWPSKKDDTNNNNNINSTNLAPNITTITSSMTIAGNKNYIINNNNNNMSNQQEKSTSARLALTSAITKINFVPEKKSVPFNEDANNKSPESSVDYEYDDYSTGTHMATIGAMNDYDNFEDEQQNDQGRDFVGSEDQQTVFGCQTANEADLEKIMRDMNPMAFMMGMMSTVMFLDPLIMAASSGTSVVPNINNNNNNNIPMDFPSAVMMDHPRSGPPTMTMTVPPASIPPRPYGIRPPIIRPPAQRQPRPPSGPVPLASIDPFSVPPPIFSNNFVVRQSSSAPNAQAERDMALRAQRTYPNKVDLVTNSAMQRQTNVSPLPEIGSDYGYGYRADIQRIGVVESGDVQPANRARAGFAPNPAGPGQWRAVGGASPPRFCRLRPGDPLPPGWVAGGEPIRKIPRIPSPSRDYRTGPALPFRDFSLP